MFKLSKPHHYLAIYLNSHPVSGEKPIWHSDPSIPVAKVSLEHGSCVWVIFEIDGINRQPMFFHSETGDIYHKAELDQISNLSREDFDVFARHGRFPVNCLS